MQKIKILVILWMLKTICGLQFFCPLYSTTLASEDDSLKKGTVYKRIYHTQRISGNLPVIDGRLNDDCWNSGSWSEYFVQQLPAENTDASEKTNLKVLYDDKYIYVGIRAFEKDISKMHRHFGKRDEISGDVVGICFDSYFDHRFGYEFDISAAGNQIDLIIDNEGVPDFNWNAVWDGATAIGDSAWTAEMRIPLSQIRFNNQESQIWGMHAWRRINRLQEEDQWSLIPRNNSGFIYSFGEIHGIDKIMNRQRFELFPYGLGKAHFSQKETGNPFSSGFDKSFAMGLDGKVGLGTGFTADFTINPDFGQVESDPSVMNLTAFETYFEEKRPFFLEGRNILNYSFGEDQLFYSRRIGHAPSYWPDVDNSNQEYAHNPENTSIISAVKISGKTAGGFSLGILQGLTSREMVEISTPERTHKEVSEPLTNYFVSRLQKDYKKGNTIIGGIFTASNRFFSESNLDNLNKSAFTGGIDLEQYFHDRNYFLRAKAVISDVNGSNKAITDLQRSPAHYFQRDDARYLSVDTSLTSLTGTGGQVAIGREGNNRFRFNGNFSWRSPGLDLNDIGYMMQADNYRQTLNFSWVENKPGKIFRSYQFLFEEYAGYTFGGERQELMLRVNGQLQFLNKYGINMNVNRLPQGFNTTILRGGPGLVVNPFWCFSGSIYTDNSKPVAGHITGHIHLFNDGYSGLYEVFPSMQFRINSKYNISAEFNYSRNFNAAQYVGNPETDMGKAYVLGNMSQTTYGMTFRLNMIFSPKLSVQYYGSPFISKGNFNDLKKVVNPKAAEFEDRFHYYTPTEIQYLETENIYQITEMPGHTYQVDNPDFSFHEFRSNLVAKWEYRRGSFIYLVWSHNRSGSNAWYQPSMSENLSDLFAIYPSNVFLIKLNYYFSL